MSKISVKDAYKTIKIFFETFVEKSSKIPQKLSKNWSRLLETNAQTSEKSEYICKNFKENAKKFLAQFWVRFGKYFESFKLIMSKSIKTWDLLVRLKTLMQKFAYRNIFLAGSSESFIRDKTRMWWCKQWIVENFRRWQFCKYFKILLISGAAPVFFWLMIGRRGSVGSSSEFCKGVADYWVIVQKSSYKGLVEGYNLLLEECGLAEKLETNLQIKILCTFLF